VEILKTCESEYDVYVPWTKFIKWTPNGEAYAGLNVSFLLQLFRQTNLFPRRCLGIYLSQSYSHMCTKFGW
jgi:hypothetical protein